MNQVSGKLKDENKWSDHRELISIVAGSCVYFLSFGVCKSMNAKSTIEKL
jgi:hypothetical protein